MKLEINGTIVPHSGPLALTVQGAEIGEMASGAAYTNRAKLLPTPDTRRAVGDAQNVVKEIAAGWQKARLLAAGIDMLADSGQAKVVNDGVEVEIRGAGYSFFDLCRKTKLEDLPGWDTYDFEIGPDILTRVSLNDPIAFPLIGWGFNTPTDTTYTVIGTTDVVRGFPDILLSVVVERIVAGLGYTLVQVPGNGWDILSIPFCGEVFTNKSRYFANNNISRTDTTPPATLSGTNVTLTAPTISSLRIGGGGGSFRFVNANADYCNAAFHAALQSYNLQLNAGIVAKYELRLEIYHDSETPGVDPPLAAAVIQSGVGSAGYTEVDAAWDGELLAGEGVEAHLVLEIVPAGAFITVTYTATTDGQTATGELTASGLINKEGRTVTAEAVLPGWDCATLLQNALKHAGAFIFVDERQKQVSILSASQLDTLRGYAQDWSGLFRAKEARTVQLGAFAETNRLRFANDSDVTATAGAGQFVLSRLNDGTQKNFVTLDFGPSKNAVVCNQQAAEVLLWQLADTTGGDSIYNRKATDTIRLLRRATVNPSFLVRYSTGGSGPSTLVARFDGAATLSYAAANQYATIAQWANVGDEFTVKLQIPLSVIATLNTMREVGGLYATGLAIPVYFRKLNGYFLVKEITDWQDSNTLCSATLTKI